jgi:RNA polymerase sigma-70 factor (ECF subfamily)
MLEPLSESPSPEAPAKRPEAVAPVSPPDLLLIERARARDPLAWQALMQRYNQRLFRIARSVLLGAEAAADRVEETYLRACAELPGHDPGGKLGSWLSHLAFSQALDGQRPVPQEATTAAGKAAAGKTAARDAGEVRALERAIDDLPEVFRTVLVLRMLEGISGTETAACLGVNETTVRTRLHRALRRLPAGAGSRVSAERAAIFRLEPALDERIIKGVLARIDS